MNAPGPSAGAHDDRPALAVMLSGTGRTLINLCARIDDGTLPARIALVIASRECLGAQRARDMGLRVRVLPGTLDAHTLGDALDDAGAAYVALAGYLNLVRIPKGFEGRVVNIHPALLPAFGGKGMYGERVHRAVLEAGCRVSGCTVHLCDDRYDTGPILAQRACEALLDDSPETLASRVFALECEVYPATIRALVEGRVRVETGGRRARIIPG